MGWAQRQGAARRRATALRFHLRQFRRGGFPFLGGGRDLVDDGAQLDVEVMESAFVGVGFGGFEFADYLLGAYSSELLIVRQIPYV